MIDYICKLEKERVFLQLFIIWAVSLSAPGAVSLLSLFIWLNTSSSETGFRNNELDTLFKSFLSSRVQLQESLIFLANFSPTCVKYLLKFSADSR